MVSLSLWLVVPLVILAAIGLIVSAVTVYALARMANVVDLSQKYK